MSCFTAPAIYALLSKAAPQHGGVCRRYLGLDAPMNTWTRDMGPSATCPKCGTSSLRHSRWQRKDGAFKRLFYAAVRCQACQSRQIRFSPWGAALTVGVVLLVALVAGVIYSISM